MRQPFLAAIAMLLMRPVLALEPSLWRDLEVEVQAIPGQMQINGVPVRVIRFIGSDASEIERRWLSMKQSLSVRTLSMESWRVHSVLEEAASEVLQIRTNDKEPEVIWSSMQLSPAVTVRSEARLLPRSCQAGRTIEGPKGDEHFLQHSVICRGRPDSILDDIRDSMRLHGHRIVETSVQGLEAITARSRLTFSVLPTVESGVPQSFVVLLERELPGARK